MIKLVPPLWEVVTDAIVTSFEGGSNHWLRAGSYLHTPAGTEKSPVYSDPWFWYNGGTMNVFFDDPHSPGGEDEATVVIGANQLCLAIGVMSCKSPEHFATLLAGEGDAVTADVFMQYVVLGDIVYG